MSILDQAQLGLYPSGPITPGTEDRPCLRKGEVWYLSLPGSLGGDCCCERVGELPYAALIHACCEIGTAPFLGFMLHKNISTLHSAQNRLLASW